MARSKGVGQSPFNEAQLKAAIEKVESGKQVTREEGMQLLRISEKLKARQKLTVKESTAVLKLFNVVAKGRNKMDKIIEMATSGKKISPQELLALQTGMYEYTHKLELVTKIVEKTTEGVKKTMQTQV
ncbi:MAG: hypothetical protein HWN65_03655 [Candidatus Helarchaeota archaeon]|nr:hypothetical protein [Candidatus Helarchaeota archaeon]